MSAQALSSIYDIPAPVLTQNEKLAIHAQAVETITAAHGERPIVPRMKDTDYFPFASDHFEGRIKAAWWDRQVAMLTREMCAWAASDKQAMARMKMEERSAA